jgi:hypothetical protein
MMDLRSGKALVACLAKIWLLLQDGSSASTPTVRSSHVSQAREGKTDFGMQTDMPRKMINA